MSPTFSSFDRSLNVVLFGASGGIGQAILDLLTQSPDIKQIVAASRTPLDKVPSKCTAASFDLRDEESVSRIAHDLDFTPNLVLVTTGLLHHEALNPEKTWRHFSAEAAEESFAVNAVGPMMIAKHFLPLMPRDSKSVFGALSAKVGSISDNGIGGWYSYRAAKAALNQFIKCSAIELARKNQNATCVGLHPGTVDTQLSKKFQGNVADGKLFSPERAAAQLLSVVDSLTPSKSGELIGWDGEIISP